MCNANNRCRMSQLGYINDRCRMSQLGYIMNNRCKMSQFGYINDRCRMSQLGYELLRASTPRTKYYTARPDRAAPVCQMNRIAIVAIERFILLMNNTMLLTRHHRLSDIYEVSEGLFSLHQSC